MALPLIIGTAVRIGGAAVRVLGSAGIRGRAARFIARRAGQHFLDHKEDPAGLQRAFANSLHFRVDVSDLQKLERFGAQVDGRVPLTAFYEWWKAVVSREWGKVKATGGTFRDWVWERHADQYEGVPAWGIPGRVLGRRRNPRTKHRIEATSTTGQDTGDLLRSVLTDSPRIHHVGDHWVLEIGGDTLDYGEAVFSYGGRNPIQWAKEDPPQLQTHCERYLQMLLRRFGIAVLALCSMAQVALGSWSENVAPGDTLQFFVTFRDAAGLSTTPDDMTALFYLREKTGLVVVDSTLTLLGGGITAIPMADPNVSAAQLWTFQWVVPASLTDRKSPSTDVHVWVRGGRAADGIGKDFARPVPSRLHLGASVDSLSASGLFTLSTAETEEGWETLTKDSCDCEVTYQGAPVSGAIVVVYDASGRPVTRGHTVAGDFAITVPVLPIGSTSYSLSVWYQGTFLAQRTPVSIVRP